MLTSRQLEYRRRPSTAAYMLRAFYPELLRGRGPFPSIRATWRPVRPEGAELSAFARLTGLSLESRVSGQRVLEKGVEVDLHTTLRSERQLEWESVTTFYYRGRFGEAREVRVRTAAAGRERDTRG